MQQLDAGPHSKKNTDTKPDYESYVMKFEW